MIEILMRNLLSNAWKYTSKLAEASIKVYKKCDLGFEQICVSDNGAGFDMSYANRLFQPFQRLHRLEEFPGLGIGLATVERIVHRHGGSIQAHSQVDQGTTFSFSFSDHQQNNR
jgi:signal transduction histidine kinase